MVTQDRLALVNKYDRPVPRYTSYPTVPYWKGIDLKTWDQAVEKCLSEDGQADLSLYVHVPYCRALCAFCGCTKVISRDSSKGPPFVEAVLKELDLKMARLPRPRFMRELHFGGGTPTWLPAPLLEQLIEGIRTRFDVDPKSSPDISIEVDPRTITHAHVEVLARQKVERVSLGVQDFYEETLKAIKREQPFERVEEVVQQLRAVGLKWINFDLVYGLPYQTEATISETIDRVVGLKPSRIALYSYAHIPQVKPAQQGVEKHGLPTPVEKRRLYEVARESFLKHGYLEIGMDHFALPTDELSIALAQGRLHRNFMGYTVQKTNLLLGLGPSSLSDAWYAFSQNEKEVAAWLERVNAGDVSPIGGHLLSDDDLAIRELILELICNYRVKLTTTQWENLREKSVVRDGFVEWNEKTQELLVNEMGKPFIRNICAEFDAYLSRSSSSSSDAANKKPIFSRSI